MDKEKNMVRCKNCKKYVNVKTFIEKEKDEKKIKKEKKAIKGEMLAWFLEKAKELDVAYQDPKNLESDEKGVLDSRRELLKIVANVL